MSYEHKDNTGSLFKNEKRTKDTQAQAVGSAVIEGVAYWMDAWTNEKNGARYQSLKFRKKENQGGAQKSYATKDDDDDTGPPF
jgi:hypothetical protein